MNKLVSLVGVGLKLLVGGLLVGGAAAIAYQYIASDLVDLRPKTVRSMQGAFFGAFFAFVFVWIADLVRRVVSRSDKHYNALIRFQHLLNENIGLLDECIGVSEEARKLLQDGSSDDQPKRLYGARFPGLVLERGTLVDLANLGLLNDLFSSNVTLRKLDSVMAGLNVSFDKATDALLAGTLEPSSYSNLMKALTRDLQDLEGFLEEAFNTAVHNLATVRILSKRKPLVSRALSFINLRKDYPRYVEKELKNETLTLRQELEATKAASRERIAKVAGRTGSEASVSRGE